MNTGQDQAADGNAGKSPRAFISHASEDKARFVVEFSSRLRAKGVDAWLDRWEIMAGDSLIDKIFQEGIKTAQAFIIVLSSKSVEKPWVREELDSGMVRKIEKSCRVIPVIIDKCDVPQALSHLKWVKIGNLGDYESELAEIVSSIFGLDQKPPLGTPPAHFTTPAIISFPGLTKADNLILIVLCRHFLKTGWTFMTVKEVHEDLTALGFNDEEVQESLEIMNGRFYLRKRAIAGGYIWGVELTTRIVDAFIRSETPRYDAMIGEIISMLVNESINTTKALHEATQIPLAIVIHVLSLFEERGLIKTVGAAGFHDRKIVNVSAELKRALRH